MRFFKRTRLAELCLKDNPITGEHDYREKVYKLLGADLEILDRVDRQGNAVDQESSFNSESSVVLGIFRMSRWRAGKAETVWKRSR